MPQWLDKFLGRTERLSHAPTDDFWYNDAGASITDTGIYVAPASSLQAVGVYACVNVLAQTVASLPLNVLRRDGDSTQVDQTHELYDVLHNSPNEELTSFEFWEMEMAKLCTWGNSYSRLEMVGPKKIVEALHPLRPDYVQVKRDAETRVRYYEYREPGFGAPEILMDDQVLHIPGLGYDGLKGYSPIELMRRPIEMAIAAETYGARFFKNNAVPPAYISFPAGVGQKALEDWAEWFKRKFGGVRNAHKLGVIDSGGEIKTVPINHRDIQFLELRKFQLEEIARIYRVPLHLIQSLERSTNNNIEHQGIDFAMHTIRPWLVRIEKRLNKALFGPRERQIYFAEFNMDALLRGDAASRAEYYSKMIGSAAMKPNEARRKENLPPVEGGDRLYIQGAMIPVEMAGQHLQQAQEKVA
jgi:HK97 family phage portal protein